MDGTKGLGHLRGLVGTHAPAMAALRQQVWILCFHPLSSCLRRKDADNRGHSLTRPTHAWTGSGKSLLSLTSWQQANPLWTWLQFWYSSWNHEKVGSEKCSMMVPNHLELTTKNPEQWYHGTPIYQLIYCSVRMALRHSPLCKLSALLTSFSFVCVYSSWHLCYSFKDTPTLLDIGGGIM